jgi:hypothetical protein
MRNLPARVKRLEQQLPALGPPEIQAVAYRDGWDRPPTHYLIVPGWRWVEATACPPDAVQRRHVKRYAGFDPMEV